mgnify:CR=1 FL=1
MSKSINWYYHRKNCTSCTRAQDLIQSMKVNLPEMIIANKVKFYREDALKLIRECDVAMITRGRKRIDVSINTMSDEEIASLALGRSGTLRAPAFRIGKRFVIGFHAEAYQEFLGESK